MSHGPAGDQPDGGRRNKAARGGPRGQGPRRSAGAGGPPADPSSSNLAPQPPHLLAPFGADPDSEAETLRWRSALNYIALSLLIVVLMYFLLRELGAILRPLFVAVFLGYLIVPAHTWLRRFRIASWISYAFIATATLSTSYGLGVLIYNSMSEISGKIPLYQTQVNQLVERGRNSLPERIRDSLDEPDVQPLKQFLSVERLTGVASSALGTVTDFFTNALIVMFYMIFLLSERASFEKRLIHAFGFEKANYVNGLVIAINRAVTQYIVVKSFVSLVAGVLVGFLLWFFGVDFAVLWGVLTFFANFIPYLGSLVAVALPITLAFLQLDPFWKGWLLLFLLLIVHLSIGYLVEPRMLGRRLGVSPLMLLLSLGFWGSLWGVTGMILAVPLIMLVKIILENVRQTEPIARMMSNI